MTYNQLASKRDAKHLHRKQVIAGRIGCHRGTMSCSVLKTMGYHHGKNKKPALPLN